VCPHLLGGGSQAAAALAPTCPPWDRNGGRREKWLLALLSFPTDTQPRIRLLGVPAACVLPAGIAPDSGQPGSPTTEDFPYCSWRFFMGHWTLRPCGETHCSHTSAKRGVQQKAPLPFPRQQCLHRGTVRKRAPQGAARLQLLQVASAPTSEPVACSFGEGTSKAASQGQMPAQSLSAAPEADPREAKRWTPGLGRKGTLRSCATLGKTVL